MKANHRKAYRVLKQIARSEGIMVDEVIDVINASIQQAYAAACISGQTDIMERWKRIPCSGELPNALELLEYLGENYRKMGML